MNYKRFGLNEHLRPENSISGKKREFVDDIRFGENYQVPTEGISYTSLHRHARPYKAVVSLDGSGGTFRSLSAAITYVAQLGGGNILIRNGTYIVDSVIRVWGSNNIGIYGESMSSTVIKVADGADLDAELFDIDANMVTISSLTIDGNKAGQGAGNQFLIVQNSSRDYLNISNIVFKNQYGGAGSSISVNTGTGMAIENCYLLDGDGDGISVVSTDNVIILNCYATGIANNAFGAGLNNVVVGCVAYNCGGIGFISYYPGAKFIGCLADSCGEDGFYFFDDRSSAIGCISRENSQNGFYIADTNNCSISGGVALANGLAGVKVYGAGTKVKAIITGNQITANKQDGIILDEANNCIISGNYVEYDSLTDNTYSGVLLTGTSTRNAVTGNSISDVGGNNFKYGVRENSSNDDYNLIDGNIVSDGKTAKISTQGANTAVGDNITA